MLALECILYDTANDQLPAPAITRRKKDFVGLSIIQNPDVITPRRNCNRERKAKTRSETRVKH
ncbi:hypothetical protein JOD29_003400 [Lysinibacillus composti]|nr:hypothetical protein [Lysinibacillus composti]